MLCNSALLTHTVHLSILLPGKYPLVQVAKCFFLPKFANTCNTMFASDTRRRSSVSGLSGWWLSASDAKPRQGTQFTCPVFLNLFSQPSLPPLACKGTRLRPGAHVSNAAHAACLKSAAAAMRLEHWRNIAQSVLKSLYALTS